MARVLFATERWMAVLHDAVYHLAIFQTTTETENLEATEMATPVSLLPACSCGYIQLPQEESFGKNEVQVVASKSQID